MTRLVEHGGLLSLTGRERDVLAAAARGLSNADTAAELGLSIETIKTHRRKLLARLGVNSILRAVAVWNQERGVDVNETFFTIAQNAGATFDRSIYAAMPSVSRRLANGDFAGAFLRLIDAGVTPIAAGRFVEFEVFTARDIMRRRRQGGQ